MVEIEYYNGFDHFYSYRQLIETSGREKLHYFTDGDSVTNQDGLIISVLPERAPSWTGVFVFGHKDWQYSGVYTTPNPNTICVLSLGQGYWVSVTNPENYEVIPALPIRGVIPLEQQELILFVDQTSVTAYGRDGKVWRSRNIAPDDIQITNVEGDYARVEFLETWPKAKVQFKICLKTGKHEVL